MVGDQQQGAVGEKFVGVLVGVLGLTVTRARRLSGAGGVSGLVRSPRK
ncbi:hypothetical protein OG496_06415 [Streptomyces sp. NBC_00988]|nr:hypothetical protein OG496_06415 [Streptomyces sp. NBC_00988]